MEQNDSIPVAHGQLCEYGATVKYMEQHGNLRNKMGFKYDLNRLIYPMINDFNAFYRMIYDLKCENCVKEVMYKMDLLENMDRDVAILNSLANYTYTHQLLKCKAFCFKSIVLQLILVLLYFG